MDDRDELNIEVTAESSENELLAKKKVEPDDAQVDSASILS